MARRYFIAPDQIGRGESLIKNSDAHHLCHVMRVQPGAVITVFDGTGQDYQAKVIAVEPDAVKVVLQQETPARCESALAITVVQGYLKDKKMDKLVRQLTELGIARWSPVLAKRSVAVPDPQRYATRHQRWIKISQEAVKQCGRSRAMTIDALMTFNEAIQRAPSNALKLIFCKHASEAAPLEQLRATQPTDVFMMIGPEGGFDRREIDLAVACDFQIVSMGPRILRAETATLAASAVIQFLFGDMNQKILDNSGGV